MAESRVTSIAASSWRPSSPNRDVTGLAPAYLRRLGFTSASPHLPSSACRSFLGMGSSRISTPTRRNASSRLASASGPVSVNQRFAAFRARSHKAVPAVRIPSDRQQPCSPIAASSPTAWHAYYLALGTCRFALCHAALPQLAAVVRMMRRMSASSGLGWSFCMFHAEGREASSLTRERRNGRALERFTQAAVSSRSRGRKQPTPGLVLRCRLDGR
jgi:hypothetical protein